VEKNQYELCVEVLRRLDRAGILTHVVLVGSWCTLFYEKYFTGVKYAASLKTRDIDFLISRPSAIRQTVDVPELLKDLGFVTGFTGPQGYIRLEHPQLIVEFLVPEKGRGSEKPFRLPQLGLNAQALRFLELLGQNTVNIKAEEMTLMVPHPANFALHKLLVAQRRPVEEKAMKDMQAATAVLKALTEKDETDYIKSVFFSLPKRWQSKIRKSIEGLSEQNLLDLFGL
jgi:hypothetical protein